MTVKKRGCNGCIYFAGAVKPGAALCGAIDGHVVYISESHPLKHFEECAYRKWALEGFQTLSAPPLIAESKKARVEPYPDTPAFQLHEQSQRYSNLYLQAS